MELEDAERIVDCAEKKLDSKTVACNRNCPSFIICEQYLQNKPELIYLAVREIHFEHEAKIQYLSGRSEKELEV